MEAVVTLAIVMTVLVSASGVVIAALRAQNGDMHRVDAVQIARSVLTQADLLPWSSLGETSAPADGSCPAAIVNAGGIAPTQTLVRNGVTYTETACIAPTGTSAGSPIRITSTVAWTGTNSVPQSLSSHVLRSPRASDLPTPAMATASSGSTPTSTATSTAAPSPTPTSTGAAPAPVPASGTETVNCTDKITGGTVGTVTVSYSMPNTLLDGLGYTQTPFEVRLVSSTISGIQNWSNDQFYSSNYSLSGGQMKFPTVTGHPAFPGVQGHDAGIPFSGDPSPTLKVEHMYGNDSSAAAGTLASDGIDCPTNIAVPLTATTFNQALYGTALSGSATADCWTTGVIPPVHEGTEALSWSSQSSYVDAYSRTVAPINVTVPKPSFRINSMGDVRFSDDFANNLVPKFYNYGSTTTYPLTYTAEPYQLIAGIANASYDLNVYGTDTSGRQFDCTGGQIKFSLDPALGASLSDGTTISEGPSSGGQAAGDIGTLALSGGTLTYDAQMYTDSASLTSAGALTAPLDVYLFFPQADPALVNSITAARLAVDTASPMPASPTWISPVPDLFIQRSQPYNDLSLPTTATSMYYAHAEIPAGTVVGSTFHLYLSATDGSGTHVGSGSTLVHLGSSALSDEWSGDYKRVSSLGLQSGPDWTPQYNFGTFNSTNNDQFYVTGAKFYLNNSNQLRWHLDVQNTSQSTAAITGVGFTLINDVTGSTLYTAPSQAVNIPINSTGALDTTASTSPPTVAAAGYYYMKVTVTFANNTSLTASSYALYIAPPSDLKTYNLNFGKCASPQNSGAALLTGGLGLVGDGTHVLAFEPALRGTVDYSLPSVAQGYFASFTVLDTTTGEEWQLSNSSASNGFTVNPNAGQIVLTTREPLLTDTFLVSASGFLDTIQDYALELGHPFTCDRHFSLSPSGSGSTLTAAGATSLQSGRVALPVSAPSGVVCSTESSDTLNTVLANTNGDTVSNVRIAFSKDPSTVYPMILVSGLTYGIALSPLASTPVFTSNYGRDSALNAIVTFHDDTLNVNVAAPVSMPLQQGGCSG